jgi:hypothetical protein
MPNVLVETRGGWLGAKQTAFLDAIHAATVEALRIPPHALVHSASRVKVKPFWFGATSCTYSQYNSNSQR